MFPGTLPQAVDVVGFTPVGVATEAIVRGLSLQSGHTYYATVRGKQNTKTTINQLLVSPLCMHVPAYFSVSFIVNRPPS